MNEWLSSIVNSPDIILNKEHIEKLKQNEQKILEEYKNIIQDPLCLWKIEWERKNMIQQNPIDWINVDNENNFVFSIKKIIESLKNKFQQNPNLDINNLQKSFWQSVDENWNLIPVEPVFLLQIYLNSCVSTNDKIQPNWLFDENTTKLIKNYFNSENKCDAASHNIDLPLNNNWNIEKKNNAIQYLNKNWITKQEHIDYILNSIILLIWDNFEFIEKYLYKYVDLFKTLIKKWVEPDIYEFENDIITSILFSLLFANNDNSNIYKNPDKNIWKLWEWNNSLNDFQILIENLELVNINNFKDDDYKIIKNIISIPWIIKYLNNQLWDIEFKNLVNNKEKFQNLFTSKFNLLKDQIQWLNNKNFWINDINSIINFDNQNILKWWNQVYTEQIEEWVEKDEQLKSKIWKVFENIWISQTDFEKIYSQNRLVNKERVNELLWYCENISKDWKVWQIFNLSWIFWLNWQNKIDFIKSILNISNIEWKKDFEIVIDYFSWLDWNLKNDFWMLVFYKDNELKNLKEIIDISNSQINDKDKTSAIIDKFSNLNIKHNSSNLINWFIKKIRLSIKDENEKKNLDNAIEPKFYWIETLKWQMRQLLLKIWINEKKTDEIINADNLNIDESRRIFMNYDFNKVWENNFVRTFIDIRWMFEIPENKKDGFTKILIENSSIWNKQNFIWILNNFDKFEKIQDPNRKLIDWWKLMYYKDDEILKFSKILDIEKDNSKNEKEKLVEIQNILKSINILPFTWYVIEKYFENVCDRIFKDEQNKLMIQNFIDATFWAKENITDILQKIQNLQKIQAEKIFLKPEIERKLREKYPDNNQFEKIKQNIQNLFVESIKSTNDFIKTELIERINTEHLDQKQIIDLIAKKFIEQLNLKLQTLWDTELLNTIVWELNKDDIKYVKELLELQSKLNIENENSKQILDLLSDEKILKRFSEIDEKFKWADFIKKCKENWIDYKSIMLKVLINNWNNLDNIQNLTNMFMFELNKQFLLKNIAWLTWRISIESYNTNKDKINEYSNQILSLNFKDFPQNINNIINWLNWLNLTISKPESESWKKYNINKLIWEKDANECNSFFSQFVDDEYTKQKLSNSKTNFDNNTKQDNQVVQILENINNNDFSSRASEIYNETILKKYSPEKYEKYLEKKNWILNQNNRENQYHSSIEQQDNFDGIRIPKTLEYYWNKVKNPFFDPNINWLSENIEKPTMFETNKELIKQFFLKNWFDVNLEWTIDDFAYNLWIDMFNRLNNESFENIVLWIWKFFIDKIENFTDNEINNYESRIYLKDFWKNILINPKIWLKQLFELFYSNPLFLKDLWVYSKENEKMLKIEKIWKFDKVLLNQYYKDRLSKIENHVAN